MGRTHPFWIHHSVFNILLFLFVAVLETWPGDVMTLSAAVMAVNVTSAVNTARILL